MVRAYIFVLLQACFCFYIFSNGRHLAVASEVRSDKSNTCADASSCGESTIHEEAKDKTVSSPWAFMQAFSKLGTSWNHVIGEYISVVKGADGLDLKGDVHAQDMENGLKILQSMVQEAASASKDDELAWSFRTTPVGEFGKTVDDVLLAFLRWSVVDKSSSQDDKSCQLIGGINDYPSSASANAKQEINVSKGGYTMPVYLCASVILISCIISHLHINN